MEFLELLFLGLTELKGKKPYILSIIVFFFAFFLVVLAIILGWGLR